MGAPMNQRCACLALLSLLLVQGCYSTHNSGDRAGTTNWRMTVLPETPSLVAGQTLQFSASTPWGSEAIWSVLPATAGTISATGRFTASATPGQATIYAVWAKDVRYTASTGLSILAPPPPAVTSPNFVQTFGAQQAVPGTGVSNGAVVGEAVPAMLAATTDGAIKVRHGFVPPVK